MKRPLVTDTIERIAPYVSGLAAEELERRLGIKDAVKVASNENPLGPSPKALARLQAMLADAHLYPDSSAHALRTALAEKLGVALETIVVGNGSNEIIELVIRTFTSGKDDVVISKGTFLVYRLALLAHGVAFREVPLAKDDYDLDAMADAIGDRTKLVILANPNNPTGRAFDGPALRRFLGRVPKGVLVLCDEAYIEYTDPERVADAIGMRDAHPRLVVTRTFSKAYGLAGLRVGYAVAPPELAGYLNRVRAPFNVSSLAQAAAEGALGDRAHVERSRALVREGKAWLRPRILDLGLTCPESEANFLFIGLGRPAGPVFEAMLRQGVIVRPLSAFGFPEHVRITIGLPQENERVLEALRAAVAKR